MRTSCFRTSAMAVATAFAVVAFAACGEEENAGGGEEATGGGTAAEGDLDRYCELAQQLDQAGNEVFGELEQLDNATREDFEAAEREFLEANEEQVDEIVAVAPPEIEDEVQTFVEGLRARAGLGDGSVDPEAVNQADQAITQFEKENCPS